MKKTLIKGLLSISLSLVVLVGLFFIYHFQFITPADVSKKEIFRKDEAEQTERAITNFKRVIDENTFAYAPRGAHAKGHACVKAWFKVVGALDKDLQYGVLRHPGKCYKSWIRFSNGRSSIKGNNDADKDAHGMAIKLLLNEPENNEHRAQDFLMHDHPVFFAANIDDYNRFVESKNKILYFVSDINPFKWKLREMRHGLNTLKKPPASPLRTQYFSNTAYKLGPHNIKFSAKTCVDSELPMNANTKDPDFLKNIMQIELDNGQACFDFLVQKQNSEENMPIEDPSIQWNQDDAPFIKVASITIPAQEFNNAKQQEFCEDISFSPWHGLKAHRPIGQLNRIRQMVYEASAEYRLFKNNKQPVSDLIW